MSEQAGKDSPHLDRHERRQAMELAPVGPLVIHELIREQGETEQARSFSGLAWSGLAAGLSIGFSMVAQAYMQSMLPDAPWAPLVDSFGYSLGFLIVILGQQQLYTELALTAVIPALTSRTVEKIIGMLRVWGIVLATNLVGTWLFAAISAQDWVFTPEARAAMLKMGLGVIDRGFWQTTVLAGSSGWLIGLMVWLLPGAGPSRPWIIILLTYVVALCHLPHVVAGSVETAFAVVSGHAGIGDYVWRFLVPVTLGNTFGGTALAALLNHAPIAEQLTGKGDEEEGVNRGKEERRRGPEESVGR